MAQPAPLNPHHADPGYWDEGALRSETQRVLEICHGCRRCWNLCPSFGNLFKRIDELDDQLNETHPVKEAVAGVYSDSGHAAQADPSLASTKDPVEALSDADRRRVVDECYQCKLCYNHCPYHPPHRYQLDFPRLMQRFKAVEVKAGRGQWRDKLFARVDLVGRLSCAAAPLVNRLNRNSLFRRLLRLGLGVHPGRDLPPFAPRTFRQWWTPRPLSAGGRPRVVLFYTCSVNYNEPGTGRAAVAVLEKNGFEVLCPPQACCGMPHLDGGDIDAAKEAARRNLESLLPYAREGLPILALGPTCSYMLKEEYPALLRSDEARLVGGRTRDICEFLVQLKREGRLSTEFAEFDGTIAYQPACHLKAQNIGFKSKELLELLPKSKVALIDRCSAHDGTWSMKDEYFELSLKTARKLFEEIEAAAPKAVATDCPLSGVQIAQGTGLRPRHPIELIARAYGFQADD